ncbi:hypothetical protein ACYATO_08705 [Lactobacillaceae bacterium Melli_B3]
MQLLTKNDYQYYVLTQRILKDKIQGLYFITKHASGACKEYFLNKKEYSKLSRVINNKFNKKELGYMRKNMNLKIDENDLVNSISNNLRMFEDEIQMRALLNAYDYYNVDTSQTLNLLENTIDEAEYLLEILHAFDQLINNFNEFISDLNIKVIDAKAATKNSFTTIIKAKLPDQEQLLLKESSKFYSFDDTSDEPITVGSDYDKNNIFEFRLSEVSASDENECQAPYVFSPEQIFFGPYRGDIVVDEFEFVHEQD